LSENMYCIVYTDNARSYDWYSYVKKENISELAKYLNNRLKNSKDEVKEVFLTTDYNDSNKEPVFFFGEYSRQEFMETYEERLLYQHELEQLLV
jgi:hypothetical protein